MTASDPRALKRALSGFQGALRANVPLAPLTHVRFGGAAEWFAEPYTEDGAAAVVRAARELDLPLHVLGGGSNLVVADEGVRGVVLSLARMNRVVRDGERVSAGAGVTVPSLIRSTKQVGLAGLEVLTGVPAVVGGAVAMNAGTREGETFDRLVSLTLLDGDGRLQVVGQDGFSPRYRDGGLGERVCVQATWQLEPDSPEAIFARFEDSLKKRNATQPVTERSVGCVFTNPQGDAAGRLIEAAGCKLLAVGGVQVSGKHANYFVNSGQGTCADFRALMEQVQRRVQAEFGVELVPEVRFWGL